MKKSKNQILSFVLLLILLGCTDNSSHKAISYIVNNSGYNIKIYFFKDSIQRTDYFQSINTGEKREVYKEVDEGKGKGFSYYRELDGAADSIEVQFENSGKAVHYGYRTVGTNSNAILYSDSRSIFNGSAWNEKTLIDTKKKTETEYTFTFTKEDFQKAK